MNLPYRFFRNGSMVGRPAGRRLGVPLLGLFLLVSVSVSRAREA